MSSIDSTHLKEILNYDPVTGIFTWRETGSGRKRLIAGCLRNGYITINIDNKRYQAHRLALIYIYGECNSYDVDHINGIKHDNRIVNLRPATRSENKQNRLSTQPNNKSGYTGVDWKKSVGKWRATITTMRKQKHLGFFNTPHEAYAAYVKAKRELHSFSTI
tara:strand:- start:305 stop:790 length:486 start_codon:yes stop_codon:yes gene_type:complete